MGVKTKEVLLGELQNNLQAQQDKMLQVLETIRDENISNYPILVAYPTNQGIEIGIELPVEKGNWGYNATTLEELYTKNIIEKEKIDNFRSLYNHKRGHFCVLLILEQKAEFIFVPQL